MAKPNLDVLEMVTLLTSAYASIKHFIGKDEVCTFWTGGKMIEKVMSWQLEYSHTRFSWASRNGGQRSVLAEVAPKK
jgi:hypothetical protein